MEMCLYRKIVKELRFGKWELFFLYVERGKFVLARKRLCWGKWRALGIYYPLHPPILLPIFSGRDYRWVHDYYRLRRNGCSKDHIDQNSEQKGSLRFEAVFHALLQLTSVIICFVVGNLLSFVVNVVYSTHQTKLATLWVRAIQRNHQKAHPQQESHQFSQQHFVRRILVSCSVLKTDKSSCGEGFI